MGSLLYGKSSPETVAKPRTRRPAKTASPGVLFLVGLLFFLFAAVLFAKVLIVSRSADLKGNESKNLEISRLRAESLVKLLQSRTKISNLMRAVGLGGSDLFDKTNPDKNRAIEIWVVRP
jgi:hypothetical protein